MKFRAIHVFLLGISIVAIGAASSSLFTKKQSAQEEQPKLATLAWRAQKALADGKRQVTFNAPVNDYAVPRTINGALSYYDVIVAEPIVRQSFAEDNNQFIKTWYKFRIIETLHQKKSNCPGCPAALDPPAEMLPVGTDQILMARDGGSLTVDGVTIYSPEPSFPAFIIGQKYLLFLALDHDKSVGTLSAGPYGSYIVNSGNSVTPLTNEGWNPLYKEISQKFNGSLDDFSDYLKNNH